MHAKLDFIVGFNQVVAHVTDDTDDFTVGGLKPLSDERLNCRHAFIQVTTLSQGVDVVGRPYEIQITEEFEPLCLLLNDEQWVHCGGSSGIVSHCGDAVSVQFEERWSIA
jgi:hypothetical protein